MKLIRQDLKNREIKLSPESNDDVWYLSQIIDEGDLVKGKTFRKIKIDKGSDTNTRVAKKPVFIKIKVKKTELSDSSLRVLGIITEASDDIPLGEHHSFNLEPNSIITIIKEHWLKFQLDKLHESTKQQTSNILIVIMDREESYFALLKKYGYELLTHIQGDVPKKEHETSKKNNFYDTILAQMNEYDKRYSLTQIILASPAFWKEELMKAINDENIKKKVIQAACSSVDKQAINEVIKRPETKQALKQDRLSRESILVEQLFTEISRNGKAAYGNKEVETAINSGAVQTLLITDNLIKKTRRDNTYRKLETLMKLVESANGEVHLISSEHDAGRRLDGLGGIGAILRYKMNYR